MRTMNCFDHADLRALDMYVAMGFERKWDELPESVKEMHGGHIGVFLDLQPYVDLLRRVCEITWRRALTLGWEPDGVFEYEVADEFGEWLAVEQMPAGLSCLERAIELAVAFFMRGVRAFDRDVHSLGIRQEFVALQAANA